MDGTEELCASFVRAAPESFQTRIVTYPNARNHEELLELARSKMPQTGRFLLIAESFSGPAAIRLAAGESSRVIALVLSNSFAGPPRNRLFRFLPWRMILSLPLPDFAIKWFVTGRHASPELVRAARHVLNNANVPMFAARMAAVFATNEWETLKSLRCPVFYLRGDADRLIPRSVSAEIQKAAGAAITVLPAPHVLLESQPQAAWAAIRAFVG